MPKKPESLKSQLDNHDWMTQLIDSSPSENMKQVHTVLTSTIDRYIPLGTRIVNSKHLRREPWLTSGIKISIDRTNGFMPRCSEMKWTTPLTKSIIGN